jgi:uncharacterized protein (TIGR03067 family)
MKLVLLLLASISLSNAFGDAAPDAATTQLRALAGTWQPVSAENNGVPASVGQLTGRVWIRRPDGRWTMLLDGKAVVEWTIKAIDSKKSPKTIDIEISAGAYKGVVYLGIYELKGDTLRICFALPDKPVRPTDFSAARGSVRALTEFRRVKQV